MSDIFRKNDKSKGIVRRTGNPKQEDKFVVKIDDAVNGASKGNNFQSNRPMRNGEIYFANYQKNKSETAAKIYASSYEASPSDKKTADKKPETKKAETHSDKADSHTKIVEPVKSKDPAPEATQLFENTKVAEKSQEKKQVKTASDKKKKVTEKQAKSDEKTTQQTRLERAAARKDASAKREKKAVNTSESKARLERASARKSIASATESLKKAGNATKGKFKEARNLVSDSGFSGDSTDRKLERKKQKALKRSEPNYMKRLFLSIISVVLVTCIISAVGIGCINDVLAINGTEEEISVTIPENATTRQIISILKDEKLISSKLFCNLFTTFRGYGSVDNYISGVYYLSTDMGVEGMLNEVQENYSYSDDDIVSLSFPEGWTIQQILEKLVNNEVIEGNNKFMNALSFEYEYDFLNENSDACFALEGVMFPDTYNFYVGESASSIVRKFLDNFNDKWTAEYQQRADQLGFTVTEILTIASIIQKEAANQEQMAGVSAVIHNRLKYSTDYPLLQCDSTANYYTKYLPGIVGESKANSYKKSYDTGDARTGLPAGPICNPGVDAIVAALYPDEKSTYLYFCHDDNGKIYYANNDVEFARNVAEAEKINEALDFQYN